MKLKLTNLSCAELHAASIQLCKEFPTLFEYQHWVVLKDFSLDIRFKPARFK